MPRPEPAIDPPPAIAKKGGQKIELPDFNIEGPSAVYDLEEDMPLWLAVLQWAGLKSRDYIVGAEIQKSVDAITPKIADTLNTFTAGYLLRVNIYVDPDGNPTVPGEEIMTSVGLGLEPTDALAEFYRLPGMQQVDSPRALTNSSFFFWITKDANGKLDARVIPKEMRPFVEESGRREGLRRERLSDFYAAMPKDGFRSVQRAEYWGDVYDRYSKEVQDDQVRADLSRLSKRMAAYQDEANRLFEEHQKAIASMVAAQKSQATLAAISTVLGLVKEGIRVGAVCSATNAPVASDGSPAVSNEEMITLQRTKELQMDGIRIRTTTEIQGSFEKLRELDQTILDRWRDLGVPVGKPEPIPIIDP